MCTVPMACETDEEDQEMTDYEFQKNSIFTDPLDEIVTTIFFIKIYKQKRNITYRNNQLSP